MPAPRSPFASKPLRTRLRQILFSLIMAGGFALLIPSTPRAACTLSGAGTAASPYLIGSYSDLKQLSATFGCDLSKTYQLTADIDASPSKSENGAWGFAPIGDSATGYFSGVFNGAGHKISNLYIVDSTKSGQVTGTNAGLFNRIYGTNARVHHLELVDAHVEGRSLGQNVGTIAGFLNYGSIDSCTVSGGRASLKIGNATSKSGNVGGVVGLNGGNGILFCQASDSVIGPDYAYIGGIAGHSPSAVIRRCKSSGFVLGGHNAYIGGITGYAQVTNGSIDSSSALNSIIGGNSTYIGGIAGVHNGTKITSSYSDIKISAGKKSSVGGLVGYGGNTGHILSNCYALGSVSAGDSSMIGGLAGDWESTSPIRTSYSIVNVGGTGTSARGQIAGYAPKAEAIHWYSYWNTKNEGQNVSIGKLNVLTDTVTAFGLSDSLMKVQSSFYAFSFAVDSAWIMVPNSYPLLRGVENATAPGFGTIPTGIRPILSSNPLSLHWVGGVAKLDLDKAAQVRVVDAAGHIVLPQTSFTAGSHNLTLPRSRSMLFAQVRTANATKTLPINPTN